VKTLRVKIVLVIIASVGAGFAFTNQGLSPPIVIGDAAAKVDQLLTQTDPEFNGVVLIAKDRRPILHKGYGWADRERTKRVTTSTPYWIASVSKQFAAAAILKLVQQSRLSLDDSIAQIFPSVPSDKQSITIHQLLTHTAGLRDDDAVDGITDRENAVAAILERPLAGSPGGTFAYTNDAYNLIAAIIEIVSKQPFEIYLREQFLKPLGLIHTGFWGPIDHPEVADILHMNSIDSSVLQPNWGYRGARGMYSTSGDLYKWYVALNEQRILSPVDVQRLFTPHVRSRSSGVGYGWFISDTSRKTKLIWARGAQGFGHGAVIVAYPEENIVIVITSNSDRYSPSVPMGHKLVSDLSEFLFSH